MGFKDFRTLPPIQYGLRFRIVSRFFLRCHILTCGLGLSMLDICPSGFPAIHQSDALQTSSVVSFCYHFITMLLIVFLSNFPYFTIPCCGVVSNLCPCQCLAYLPRLQLVQWECKLCLCFDAACLVPLCLPPSVGLFTFLNFILFLILTAKKNSSPKIMN